jgi:hypothetical protein
MCNLEITFVKQDFTFVKPFAISSSGQKADSNVHHTKRELMEETIEKAIDAVFMQSNSVHEGRMAHVERAR